MANGDRIELLTAANFEAAMSTVAQESTAKNVQAVVNAINTSTGSNTTTLSTINTNVNAIKTAIGNASTAPSVTTTGSAVNTANTIHQKLQGISQYQIGATNSTGGSSTSGNVMAKLNAILNTVNATSDTSLSSTIFVPTETNLLKTILGKAMTIGDNRLVCLGSFVPKYPGCVCIKIAGYIADVNASSSGGFMISNNLQSQSIPIYPSLPATTLSGVYERDNVTPRLDFTSITSETKTMYLNVEAGKIYYFIIQGSSLRPFTCQSVQIFGSTIYYY